MERDAVGVEHLKGEGNDCEVSSSSRSRHLHLLLTCTQILVRSRTEGTKIEERGEDEVLGVWLSRCERVI